MTAQYSSSIRKDLRITLLSDSLVKAKAPTLGRIAMFIYNSQEWNKNVVEEFVVLNVDRTVFQEESNLTGQIKSVFHWP